VLLPSRAPDRAPGDYPGHRSAWKAVAVRTVPHDWGRVSPFAGSLLPLVSLLCPLPPTPPPFCVDRLAPDGTGTLAVRVFYSGSAGLWVTLWWGCPNPASPCHRPRPWRLGWRRTDTGTLADRIMCIAGPLGCGSPYGGGALTQFPLVTAPASCSPACRRCVSGGNAELFSRQPRSAGARGARVPKGTVRVRRRHAPCECAGCGNVYVYSLHTV
jgi:hypothetical protein